MACGWIGGAGVSFDPERFDDDNQERLRSIAGVNVSSADDIEDAIGKQGPLPRICTLPEGGQSDGRLESSSKDQWFSTRLVVVIVAESWRSKADGTKGALAILKSVKDTIVTKGAARGEWQNPQANGPFVMAGWDFMQRSNRRVAYQAEFRTTVHDDFNV